MTTASIQNVPGLTVEDAGGYPVLALRNDHASARVALQGAHVLDFTPRGQKPVLWMSRRAVFAAGKAVRGGVPVCWPWFGPHPSDASKPAHGFARTAAWSLASAKRTPDGGHEAVFRLPAGAGAAVGWTAPVDLTLTVTVGTALKMLLAARNAGAAPVVLGGALHSYFAVGDVSRARVTGLDGRPYVDQLNPAARTVQAGPVLFAAETDRVYDDPGPACAVEDPAWGRRIVIEKSGSRSTVVWNPWTEKARRMADLGEDQFRDFVCVETANALADVVAVAPGGAHALEALVRTEPL